MAMVLKVKIVTVGEFLEASQVFFWILPSMAKSVWSDFSHICLFHCQEDFRGVSFVVWSFLRASEAISCGLSSKKQFFRTHGRLPSLFELIFHSLVPFIVRKTSVELILVFEAFLRPRNVRFCSCGSKKRIVWIATSKTVKNLNNLDVIIVFWQVGKWYLGWQSWIEMIFHELVNFNGRKSSAELVLGFENFWWQVKRLSIREVCCCMQIGC